ncbi:MAG: acyltransferase [Clostridiales bacterium]|nr:acyltransferase [Clostridiales bacterium]
MSEDRRGGVTVMTGILSVIVVYSHVVSEAVTEYAKDSFQFLFVFTTQHFSRVAVPCFIFLSAFKYFAKYSEKPVGFSYPRFALGRVRRVYLPYLLWVLIFYVYFVYAARYFPFDAADLARYAVTGDISAQLYFVVIIMQFYLLMPFWRAVALGRKGWGWAAAFMAVSAAVTYAARLVFARVPYIDRIFAAYLLFWAAGMVCGVNHQRFFGILARRRAAVWIAFALVTAAHLGLTYANARGFFVYTASEAVHTAYGLFAAFFLLDLGVFLWPRLGAAAPAASLVSDSSYYVFLAHTLPIRIASAAAPEGLGITARMAIQGAFAYVSSFGLAALYVLAKRRLVNRRKG